MRILHVSTRLILGGSQENTVLSCEGQARRGHEVHLAFGPIYGPEGSLLDRVERFRTSDGRAIATHVVPHLTREVRPIADWSAYRELRRLIRRLRPDVVHTHSSKAGILGRWAAWAENEHAARLARSGRGDARAAWSCRVVHTVHGPPFMPVEGGMARRLRTRLVNHAYTVAERFAARRCHSIVSVADAMTAEFLRRGIGRAEQYTTVRSGMEVEAFLHAAPGESREDSRARLGFTERDFVVGTVARLAQHKGHDDLLDALGRVARQDPTWRLLWVGDGWWRERLIARARAMGLAVRELDANRGPPDSSIVVTGMVAPDAIPAMLRAMDVLAHPSSREGLPRTVPQALLCAVCPVAYDADGTREACIEMETGRLVPTGDAPGLGAAIAWCRQNPGARQALADRGRERCRDAFAVDRMLDALERVYAGA